jgi:uncharacterized protein
VILLGGFELAAYALVGPDRARVSRLALSSAAQVAFLLVATWLASRAMPQPLVDAHLHTARALRRLGIGSLAGFAMVSLAALVPVVAGELQLAPTTDSRGVLWPSIAAQLLLLIPAAASEELMVRGLLLQQLARGIGRIAAVALTSIAFGVIHLNNPNASVFAAVNIALVGGVFGLLTLRQGSVFAAIGMHIAWNVCLGVLWGLPISGFDFGGSILVPTRVGATLWTGGAFGPEASAVTSVILLLTLLIIWRLPMRHLAPAVVAAPADVPVQP